MDILCIRFPVMAGDISMLKYLEDNYITNLNI